MTNNETYMHLYAKRVLKCDLMFREDVLRVDIEKEFTDGGFIIFVCDIVTYNENGIYEIYEVYHSHLLDKKKMYNMDVYFNKMGINPRVHQISAYKILSQLIT